ncbi:sulfite exporter TauE/SafE family protein [Massilia sp. LXY-6]|uniref:sulfite exporter TauE/SafE family protein n=1 Tax=Massilia sp. LXY-6 TaxID=3379823 RepID=UPI003EE1A157
MSMGIGVNIGGLLPLFVVGLLGSVHCAGMCGGIVGALSVAPVTLHRSRPAPPALLNVLAYNLGRIGSYMLAGALAGSLAAGIGQGAGSLARLPALQAGGYWMANLMLALLGLYLMDAWRGLARLERGGQLVWRHVQPLLRRLLPAPGIAFGPGRMLAAGALWGWLPCGMVYSVLVTAMLTGSATGGALAMLAFGLGTLPMLLGLGLLGARLRAGLRVRAVRVACGALVLGFGLLGLARAAGGLPHSWLQTICVTPGAAP